MAELIDSGQRRQFNSGAVRDIAEGKGRCDLLPLSAIITVFDSKDLIDYDEASGILIHIDEFMKTGDVDQISTAIILFVEDVLHKNLFDATLDVSIHYEDGCRKYGERNWEKGIPIHCYVDSGIRHLLKFCRGDNDEPHDRAFIWNMLGIIWTLNNFKDKNFDESILDIPCFTSSTI